VPLVTLPLGHQDVCRDAHPALISFAALSLSYERPRPTTNCDVHWSKSTLVHSYSDCCLLSSVKLAQRDGQEDLPMIHSPPVCEWNKTDHLVQFRRSYSHSYSPCNESPKRKTFTGLQGRALSKSKVSTRPKKSVKLRSKDALSNDSASARSILHSQPAPTTTPLFFLALQEAPSEPVWLCCLYCTCLWLGAVLPRLPTQWLGTVPASCFRPGVPCRLCRYRKLLHGLLCSI